MKPGGLDWRNIDWRKINWRSRVLWHGLGYAVSAAWMLYVVVATGNDVRAPLFSYIFAVPLALWIGGLLVARLLRRRD